MSVALRAFPSLDALEADLLDALGALSRSEHRFLTLLGAFDAREGWKAYGSTDCAGWLAARCGLCRGTAVEKVRVARALARLPRIDAAFAAGQLTYSQVRAVSRVATEWNEAQLLDQALSTTAEQLEQLCRRLRNADPDAAAWAARRAQEGRSLTQHVRPDGSGTLTVVLPAAELQLVLAALAQVGSTLPEDPERSLFAKDADALVALARGQLSGRRGETAGGNAGYEVVVHIDADALVGAPSAESGADLPTPVVKRLCCDGAVRPLVKDRAGNPLNVGRKQRTVPLALKRALEARDGHCRFPGCHHKRFLDAHHIRHWVDGGETSLDNLILLCSHHHTLVHDGGFAIKRGADGALHFVRPDWRMLDGVGRLSAESRAERHTAMQQWRPTSQPTSASSE